MTLLEPSPLRRLDEVDLTVLGLLQANPRAPVACLARAVRLTDNAVRYRLRRLERVGVLRGFVTVLDPRLLGTTQLHVALLRLGRPEDLAQAVQSVPQVHGAYATEGAFDAAVLACTRADEPVQPLVRRIAEVTPVLESVTLRVRDAHRGAGMPLVPVPLGFEETLRAASAPSFATPDATVPSPVSPAAPAVEPVYRR